MRKIPDAIQGGIVCLAFALSILFSWSLLRASAPARQRVQENSGGWLVAVSSKPALALGFRNFLADLAWLQAVQLAGDRRMPDAQYSRFFVLVTATVDFDPKFEIPYIAGGLILGESPSHTAEAIRILERGWKQNPGNWLYPFYIGYTRYFSLGDPVEGGRMMAEAARLPESPTYLPRLAARMLAEGRKPEAALDFLAVLEAQEKDEARRDIIRRRILEVVVERDIQNLERAAALYRTRSGEWPATLADLARTGLIAKVPREPHGGTYVLGPGGTVRSDRVAGRLRVLLR